MNSSFNFRFNYQSVPSCDMPRRHPENYTVVESLRLSGGLCSMNLFSFVPVPAAWAVYFITSIYRMDSFFFMSASITTVQSESHLELLQGTSKGPDTAPRKCP
jgi:hypothetical protein